jgi:hypothetical protein
MKKAIDEAFSMPVNPKLKQKILDNYTWEKTAEETYKAYQKIVRITIN